MKRRLAFEEGQEKANAGEEGIEKRCEKRCEIDGRGFDKDELSLPRHQIFSTLKVDVFCASRVNTKKKAFISF